MTQSYTYRFDLATDPFYCVADDEFQAKMTQEITDLNNNITHLIMSILYRFDVWTGKHYKSKFMDSKSSRGDAGKTTPLLRAFFKLKKLRRLEMRRMVLEVLMKEKILSIIYDTFFAGDVFFGVMDATQIGTLDQMYYTLLKNNSEMFLHLSR